MARSRKSKEPVVDLQPKFEETVAAPVEKKAIKRAFDQLVKKHQVHAVEAAALRAILPVGSDGLILETDFVEGRAKWRREG